MAIQADLTDIANLTKMVRRRCDDTGVRLTFGPSDGGAYTHMDGEVKCVTLPAPSLPVDKRDLTELYGLLVHEAGHHLRAEVFDIVDKRKPSRECFGIINMVEDDAMERMVAKRWKGDRIALGELNRSLSERFVSEVEKASGIETQVAAALMLGMEARRDWCDTAPAILEGVKRKMPDDAVELFNDLVDEFWVDRMRLDATPEQTVDLAEELYARMYPPKPEMPEEQQPEPTKGKDNMGEGDTKQDSSEGDSQQGGDNGEPQQEGEGDDKDGDSTPQDKDGEGDSEGEQPATGKDQSEGHMISWQDVDFGNHDERATGEYGTGGIDYTGMENNGKVNELTPLDEIRVEELDVTNYTRKHKHMVLSSVGAAQFANKVRRYLQSKRKRVVDKDKYEGELDRGSLVKLVLPPIDGGEYNKRVFYQRREAKAKDTAVVILVDGSASMTGCKYETVSKAAGLLSEVLGKVLHMPTMIALHSNPDIQYGSNKRGTVIGMVKPFHKQVNAETVAKKCLLFEDVYMAANTDEAAIRWCYAQLKKRKESRKLLIVLSDGAPSGRYISDDKDKHCTVERRRHYDGNTLELVTKAIERDKTVELYGVGLNSEAVNRYYTNSQVLKLKYGKDGVAEREEGLVATLLELIKKGVVHT